MRAAQLQCSKGRPSIYDVSWKTGQKSGFYTYVIFSQTIFSKTLHGLIFHKHIVLSVKSETVWMYWYSCTNIHTRIAREQRLFPAISKKKDVLKKKGRSRSSSTRARHGVAGSIPCHHPHCPFIIPIIWKFIFNVKLVLHRFIPACTHRRGLRCLGVIRVLDIRLNFFRRNKTSPGELLFCQKS